MYQVEKVGTAVEITCGSNGAVAGDHSKGIDVSGKNLDRAIA
jgi:hypothetical protein